MTTKHTAGEWTDRGNSCVGTHRQLVASVYPMEDENPEENAANVRLIAAAPDLLEFAQQFIDRYGMYETWMTAEARAAIAKATGEQP